jgi:transposase-like protein
MLERGLHVDHTTIYRSRATLRTRMREVLPTTSQSDERPWRVDETYVNVKKVWMYLYRAVDSRGNTLEFLLSPTRNASLGQRLLRESACCASYQHSSSHQC